MTPLIILYGTYFPIFTVIFLIVAVIRLIVRLSNRDSTSSTNYKSTYKPPVPPPGQQNPNNPYQNTGNNPYQAPGPQNPNNPYQNTGNNPYQAPGANPYQTPGANPYQAPGANPYQTPGANPYQTPGANPYQNAGQGSPYQQPNPGTQQSTGTDYRSTAIPGQQQYNPFMPAPKKPRTGLILGIVGGAVALFIGFGVIMYVRSERSKNLVRAEFTLGYENPTDVAYTIVLDGWDTIHVAPHSGSEDIDYTYRNDQADLHWQMMSEKGDVTLDTTISKADMESWYDQQISNGNYTTNIVLNPSRSEYVFWTLWYGDNGDDNLDEVQVGDSTYFVDAYVVTDPIIFDERSSTYRTKVGDAKQYSSDDEAEFLVSAEDFHVLYDHVYLDNEKYDVFNEYRNKLIRLYNAAYDDAMADGSADYNEERIMNGFDAVIPGSVDENTSASAFVSAIDYVKSEESYFKGVDHDLYHAVADSADYVLNGNFDDTPKAMRNYMAMHYVNYSVDHTGFWDDIPKRNVSYEMDRNEETGNMY